MSSVAEHPQRSSDRLLPSGRVAFLFSDIVGSTRLWEREPEAMLRDLRRHDAIMRDAIESNGGRVFKTIGDAFCAVFPHAAGAAEAAICAQRALQRESFASAQALSVRMALHAGTADERDGDYFGPTLNRAARLLAIGHGGQVLLSAAAADWLTASSAQASLRDLGLHRLKDLTAPEHVFQLLAGGLEPEFPPLVSLTLYDNNLPQQRSSLLGRDREIKEIRTLLGGARLVTLTGAGGIGKTRCALQAAAEELERYPDGAWFADLAPVRDPQVVAETIARIFDLQQTSEHTALEMLAAHLKNKRLLLVLDNCEHVIRESAGIAAAILQQSPHVRLIATSREALAIAGEALYRMPSLDPAGAAALFEERGRFASASFRTTPENAAAVSEICRRLDGIPLAIELAAARLRSLTVKQLAEKLDERLRLLTGGDRAALPRQQTMRALIDWSYDLLGDREQRIFRDLSVFAGGFTLEAAASLCASEDFDNLDVLDAVASLADKSLLLAESTPESIRYRFLESTREYAREKLQACGELAETLERHARVCAGIARELDASYEALAPQEFLDRAEREIENLRGALTWSFSKGEPETGQRIAMTLAHSFGVLAPAEGDRWVKTALERCGPATPVEIAAGLSLAHATFASVFNHFNAAYRAAKRAQELYESAGEPAAAADAQRLAGRSLLYLGRPAEGEPLLRESLELREARGSQRTGGILGDLAVARALQGDLPGARALFARAREAFEGAADASKVAIVAATLAEAEFLAGETATALRLANEALEAARGLGRFRTACAILGNIAAYELCLERADDAAAHAAEALELCREFQGDEISLLFSLQHLAAAAALRGSEPECAAAARLLGFVDARLAAAEAEREHTERCSLEHATLALEAKFPSDTLAAHRRTGAAWPQERAVAAALALARPATAAATGRGGHFPS